MKTHPRRKLVFALAYCVESLAQQPLIDTGGAIRAALDSDDRIWDHLSEQTIEILDAGLGIKRPKTDHCPIAALPSP